jgi:hypothetical protein
MRRQHTRCLGKYDFDHIAQYARKRYIEGFNTITLLKQAKSEQEREEIALVCTLEVEDDQVLDIDLDCKHASECKVTNCRSRLRKLIETELGHRRFRQ